MTEHQPTETVVANIKRYRRDRGLTAQQLSDELAALGVNLGRVGLSKLEGGKRSGISIDELYAFAVALKVQPIHLLVPEDDGAPFAITPVITEPASRVARWICGQEMVPEPASVAEAVDATRAMPKHIRDALLTSWMARNAADLNRQTNAAERAVDPDRLGGFWGPDGGFARADGVSYSADEVRELLKGDKGNG
jgi:transcriptional regulator with XRE-family HTH domain